MQPGLFFFPLYHTYEAVKDFNVLVTLTVYNRAFPDLDMVNQFLNDFPVKLLHIQIDLFAYRHSLAIYVKIIIRPFFTIFTHSRYLRKSLKSR